jgi:hypothetical protein
MGKEFQPITTIFLCAALALACMSVMQSTPLAQDDLLVRLGEEFVLGENQGAKVEGTGFAVKILKFFNSPCPPNVECFWSGIGIKFEYQYDGQVRRGINLVKAFGYRTTIVRSDYESHAVLMITRDQD